MKTACFIAFCLPFLVSAQDTVEVQTLTFDDITKRRGVYQFPEKGEYEKILMYYTLKCDARTTRDRFPCGEWDYLTYTYVYDHDATYDSTYGTTSNFLVNGTSQSTYPYTRKPVTRKVAHYWHYPNVIDTVSQSMHGIGTGNDTLASVLPFANKTGRTQMLYTASELQNAGLQTGNISALQLRFLQATDTVKCRLRAAMVDMDSLSGGYFDESNFIDLGEYEKPLDTGWQQWPFKQAINWDGTSDILLDISFQHKETKTNALLAGTTTQVPMVANTSANDDYALDFGHWRDYAVLGANDSINGNKRRTIEAWVKTRTFNGGGVFQAGITGSTDRDFSFRTTGTDNQWRIQLWGSDANAIFDSKEEWHHIALAYDGTEVKFFLDGKFFRGVNADLNTGDMEVLLGRWNNSYFNGQIDDVRIWSHFLNAKMLREWAGKEITPEHPRYKHLVANYQCNEGSGDSLVNAKGSMANGEMHGSAWWSLKKPEDLRMHWQTHLQRPNVIFEQSDYTVQMDSVLEVSEEQMRPVRIELRENPSVNHLIDDDAEKHPSNITNAFRAWPAGQKIGTYNTKTGQYDSVTVQPEGQLNPMEKYWYSPTVRYEIGRFITPYGIGLTLGDDGFTWVYDVTDYAELLKGDVDLSAGNQQELIDLKFVFIKGTPPRKVLKLENVWSYGSRSYNALSNDQALEPVTKSLIPEAQTYKVKTRLTGHGHHSDDGSFPHCCEWIDNTHYLYVNDEKEAEWKIWRDDCDINPVQPQGGTWNGSREGWCPGDVVRDHSFEITSSVGNANEVKLDYQITPVPSDNQGMGRGNYVQNMELIQYSDFNHKLDADVYEVHRPSTWEYRRHINPSCEGPLVEVRNAGEDEITSLTFSYFVEGRTPSTYIWEGQLPTMQHTLIALPIEGSDFWVGSENVFHVELTAVNGQNDDYAPNNAISQAFTLPEIYENNIVVQLKTNNVPDENRYEIRDGAGNVVHENGSFQENTTYNDTLNLPKGCYTFHLFDEGRGLDYWAWPEQGSGYLRWRSSENFGLLKEFDPDFGEEIIYGFAVGTISTVEEKPESQQLAVYPNPTSGMITIGLSSVQSQTNVQITDMAGNVLQTATLPPSQGYTEQQFNLQSLAKGIYLVKVQTENGLKVERIVMQ